jgi:hypothetical protein
LTENLSKGIRACLNFYLLAKLPSFSIPYHLFSVASPIAIGDGYALSKAAQSIEKFKQFQ